MGFSKFGKLLEGKDKGASMQLTFSMIDSGTMSIMTAFRKGTEIIGVPLVIAGTFEEINKEFFSTVVGYKARIEGFQSNMEALEAELKAKEAEAKQKIADKAKADKGKGKKGSVAVKETVKPGAAALGKEKEEEEPLGIQRGLFETLSGRADKGIMEENEGFTEEVETENEAEV